MFEYGTYGFIAEKDLETAKLSIKTNAYEGVCFFCQQSLEKLSKHYLQRQEKPLIENLLKSHKLVRLYNALDVNLENEYDTILRKLTDHYFEGRYPGIDYEPATAELAQEALRLTELIYNTVISNFLATIPTQEFE